ncbi:MAG TPA: gliding motility-associated C-terminal domain-containing protein [Hymenobacter sp.]|jgi:gliding motility-associated-like protein|uniref:T9SS type B sorting domain-containing protein n=1 Tax=Hymenobacter sp. TaxID=1898978 RepID=UPI002ED8DC88
MKLLNRWIFVLLLVLAGQVARAQNCLQGPALSCTFVAIDVNTNTPVDAFCVGRPVRFEPCAGRNIPPTLLRYGVLPGVGTTFSPSCEPPNPSTYVYTPAATVAANVTVSELANDPVAGTATYYIRTFRVYDTPAPTFTVAPCPSGSALVTVTDAVYDSYTVQVGTGAPQAIARNQATVVSAAGGSTVTVTGRYAANGVCTGSATQTLAALAPPVVPGFTRLALQGPLPGGAATLTVGNLPAGYTYTLQLADGSAPGGFRDVAPVPAGSTSFALPAPTAGCYRVLRTDPCNTSTAASPLICTLSLTGNSAQNRNQLLLSDAAAGATTYTVLRNNVPLSTFRPIPGGLEDADVQCGTAYTYQVTATQPGGGTAVSNPVTITTQSNLPPPAPRLLASFNLNNVVVVSPLLTAPLAAGITLRYRRTAGGGPAADFGTATGVRPRRDSTALTDLLAAPPCYSARLVDVCANASAESSAACPALLTARADAPDGTTASLSWTAFTGPDASIPATYVLQRVDRSGNPVSSVPVSGNAYTDLTPPANQQVLRYRLQISGAGLPPGTFSYSNVATVTRRLLLAIPTAFTPNGDGLNDVLEVKGKYLDNYVFVVVDRNGQEVFRGTKRTDAWDGTIKGHAPVLGAYVWRFQQNNEDGTPFTATGAVTILK